jgi:hypothetical protein
MQSNPNQETSSYKKYLVPSASVKSKEFLPTETRAQDCKKKDRINESEAQIRTYPRLGSKKSISAVIARASTTEGDAGTIVHLSRIWKLLHLVNFSSASSDECLFLSSVATLGLKAATDLATQHGWKCQRPLQALRALQSGRVERYPKRKPKTRRRVSRRKASSSHVER